MQTFEYFKLPFHPESLLSELNAGLPGNFISCDTSSSGEITVRVTNGTEKSSVDAIINAHTGQPPDLDAEWAAMNNQQKDQFMRQLYKRFKHL